MADSVRAWLNAAGRVPMLTAAEELHLSTMVREWQDWPDGPDAAPAPVQRRGLRARDRMVSANLRLVVSVAAAVAAKRLSSIDLHIGEGGGSTMADMLAAPAEDPLEGFDAIALVARMREAQPDDVALIELAQDHKSPELATLLDVARPTVANRLAAARGRLRQVH